MLNLLLVTLVKYWDEPHVTLLCIKLRASVAGKQRDNPNARVGEPGKVQERLYSKEVSCL